MLLGVETSIQTKERILVCNIGGGSTEMKVYEQGKIIEEVNTEVGCTDITNRFPDLYDELVKTPISEIKEYIKEHLNYPKTRCKYALFTGGHITYTKAAKYHLQQNDCFAEINVPYYIHAIEYNKNSQDTFYRTKLSDLKKTKPDNPDWFNGSRAVATMVETIFDQLNIDVMFPTDMNMIDGIMVDLYK